MTLQMDVLAELHETPVALVRFHTTVESLVCLQVTAAREPLSTDGAGVRSLTGVDETMLLKVGVLGEPTRTSLTFKWSLVVVNPKMNF